MKLKELLKNYSFSLYDITLKDLYGNEYKKKDLDVKDIIKIEELEVRNVNINFRLKEATFYIIDLYETLRNK